MAVSGYGTTEKSLVIETKRCRNVFLVDNDSVYRRELPTNEEYDADISAYY